VVNLEKKKREKQNPMHIKAKVLLRVFGFGDQDTIEGLMTFRIDSHTIRMGILWLRSLSSAIRYCKSCTCI